MTERRSKLTLEFLSPGARVADIGNASCYLLGCEQVPESEISVLLAGGDVADFCRRNRGALIVKVEADEGGAHSLRVWRGLFSFAEFYYSLAPADRVVVSDHFQNVVARIPRADRYPSDEALVQHYLYRRPYGHLTVSAGILKVGQAEEFAIDLRNRSTSVSMFDRVDSVIVERSADEYLDMVDAELQKATEVVPRDDGAALLFSGGVDSTLLLAYLGAETQTVTFVPDTPEFAPESEYARTAAAMLGASLTEVPTPERDFLTMLEFNTETLGTPSFDDSSPYFTRLTFAQPYGRLVFGQGADSAFGMSLKLARFSSWFRWPGIRQAVNIGAKSIPGHLGYRLGQVGPIANRFSRPLLDRRGYGATARASGDTPLLERAVGRKAIDAANQASLDYAVDRVVLTADPMSRFFSQIELAHWHVVMVNPVRSANAACQAAGKSSFAPYCAPNVLNALATIPVRDRYIRGLSAKWILKELLTRKVPDYPVNQRKKATALPWRRFYENGPLQDVWERYEVPDLFDSEQRAELVARPIATTWVAISHAIWLERVVRNDDLQPHEAKVKAEFLI
ncbi:MAG: asparagine synthase C-terminal domain-containing protein [Acidimicrobiia bacterium]|nr:asparagine synthase C-terminal domain-containing protein [Acidimicrobiia bacterium]